jgi:hypothetical protein
MSSQTLYRAVNVCNDNKSGCGLITRLIDWLIEISGNGHVILVKSAVLQVFSFSGWSSFLDEWLQERWHMTEYDGNICVSALNVCFLR